MVSTSRNRLQDLTMRHTCRKSARNPLPAVEPAAILAARRAPVEGESLVTLMLPAICKREVRERSCDRVTGSTSREDTDLVGVLGSVLGDDDETTFRSGGDVDSLSVGQARKLLGVNVQHVSLKALPRDRMSFPFKYAVGRARTGSRDKMGPSGKAFWTRKEFHFRSKSH